MAHGSGEETRLFGLISYPAVLIVDYAELTELLPCAIGASLEGSGDRETIWRMRIT